jgi:hypothetical protein
VVEHVLDPQTLLARLMRMLDDNGVLVITTGDADNWLWNLFGANWWYCFHLEHVSFISKPWIEHFCREHGTVALRFEKFRHVDPGPLRFIIDGVLMIIYGLAPGLYLGSVAWLKKLVRREGDINTRGQGISADHIFVALALNKH